MNPILKTAVDRSTTSRRQRKPKQLGAKNIVRLGSVREEGYKQNWDVVLHVELDNGNRCDCSVRPGPGHYFDVIPDREIAGNLRDRIISSMNSGFAILIRTDIGEEQLHAKRDFGYSTPTPKRFKVFGERTKEMPAGVEKETLNVT
jgi:hypothetical protein